MQRGRKGGCQAGDAIEPAGAAQDADQLAAVAGFVQESEGEGGIGAVGRHRLG